MSYMQQQYQMQQPIYGNMAQRPNAYQTSNNWNTNRIRPVSSIEEVRASAIDFDGSVFYFPDLANKKIYTKQINLDGTASVNMYELKEIPNPVDQQFNSYNYITRDEFENVINQLKSALQNNITAPPIPQEEVVQKQVAPVVNF